MKPIKNRIQLPATSYERRATSYERRATSYERRATSYERRATSYQLPAMRHTLRTALLALLLLLLLAACTSENPEGNTPPDDTLVEMDITLPGITLAQQTTVERIGHSERSEESLAPQGNNPQGKAATPQGSPTTRATIPLPKGRTVRVIAQGNGGVYLPDASYYVTDDAGTLAPCTVNADGSFKAAGGSKLKLKLGEQYSVIAISPALPLDTDLFMSPVPNGMDFARSSASITPATAAITLPALDRECSAISIALFTAKPTVLTAGAVPTGSSIVVSGLSAPATDRRHISHSGISPTNVYDQRITLSESSLHALSPAAASKLLYADDLIVLPRAKKLTITATFEATILEVKKLVTYSTVVSIDGQFVPGMDAGKRYNINLAIDPENATVIPTVQITDWDMSGGALKPGDSSIVESETIDYPYVTFNDAGEKSVIVFKDVHGQFDFSKLGMGSFHEPWTETPSHNYSSNFLYAISPRFEVNKKAFPLRSAWTSTNYGCDFPWRKPTFMEALFMEMMKDVLVLKAPLNSTFWTASEVNANDAYTANGTESAAPKTSTLEIRCVRDCAFAPQGNNGAEVPYAIEGKYIVFVDSYANQLPSRVHNAWTQTPDHKITDTDKSSVYNGHIEVSPIYPKAKWTSTNGPCVSPWRRPTYLELQALMALNKFLSIPTPASYQVWAASQEVTTGTTTAVPGLGGYYYFDANGAAQYTAAANADVEAYTRCVRDVVRN